MNSGHAADRETARDHLLPFRQQEVLAELVVGYGTRRLIQHFADNFAAGNRRRPDVRLVETKTDAVEPMNVDALGSTRSLRFPALR